jgi:NAD(P)-dependent dehydrogenase (short-subunit alcohol dehydrogenase family)
VPSIPEDPREESLSNLCVLVTGATSGIGELLAKRLAAAGSVVFVHGRSPAKVQALAAQLERLGASEIRSFVADLASLEQVTELADAVAESGQLDVLINNAGVGFGKRRDHRETSGDGFELRFAVNYLAPFLLTELLVARGLPKRAIVNVASAGQQALDESDLMSERSYNGVAAYCRSKLALVADTFERARRDRARAYVTLHPGTFLATQMVRDAGIEPLGSAESGALAVENLIERALGGETGAYFDTDQRAKADPAAYDEAFQERLRNRALELTQRFRR